MFLASSPASRLLKTMFLRLSLIFGITLISQCYTQDIDDSKWDFLLSKISELETKIERLEGKNQEARPVINSQISEIPVIYNATFNDKVVAFHVYAQDSFYVSDGSRVNYDASYLNTGYYDAGIFTCPASGIYFFSMNGRASSENAICELGMHVDGQLRMKTASRYTGGAQGSAASSIVTLCNIGQQVDVRAMYGDADCIYGIDNQFSGYFLQPMTS